MASAEPTATQLRRGRLIARIGLRFAAVTAILAAWVAVPPSAPAIAFPGGHRFAFSIVDDTDLASLERLKPVYAVLERHGLRTTKTVWVLPRAPESVHDADLGDALSDPEYRAFILDLHRKGFEIALHGVRGGSSPRAQTLKGLDEFKSILGQYPRMHVNHSLNQENLYWGADLYGFLPLRWLAGFAVDYEFSGEEEGSPYFWGDVARERIEYVRRFTYREINLLSADPSMPYRVPGMPYVKYWFSTSDGDGVEKFAALLNDENLDRLEREGGVCFVYAHLGAGSFNKGHDVDPRYEDRIRAIAARNGWFAPASEILDHLRAQPTWTGEPGVRQQLRLDAKFVVQHFGL